MILTGNNNFIPVLNNPIPTGMRIIVQQHASPITAAINANGILTNNQNTVANNAPVT